MARVKHRVSGGASEGGSQQYLGSLPDAGERALDAFEAVRSRR